MYGNSYRTCLGKTPHNVIFNISLVSWRYRRAVKKKGEEENNPLLLKYDQNEDSNANTKKRKSSR